MDFESPEEYLYAEITKSQELDDGSLLVYGRPSQDVLDIDDQVADKEWLKQALPEWFTSFANIREMHQAKAVGVGQKLEFDEAGDPWLLSKVVDKDAVKKVKEGVLKGYSIGIRKPVVKRDREAHKGRFVGGKIIEVSLVDRPAVPTAKFDIVKAAGANEWLDCQSGFVFEDTTKAGNIHDPGAGNSVDFDSLGNPVLQPGHLKSDDAAITVVTADDRGVVVQMGADQFLVPYTVDSDGTIKFGEPEPLPQQRRATEGPTTETPANKSADIVEVQGGDFTRAKPAQSLEAVRDQVMAKLDPPDPVSGRRAYNVSIVSTYPDYVIVERYDEGKYYRVPYTFKDGDVDVGQSEQVEQTFVPVANKAAADSTDEQRRQLIADLGKAVWTTKYIDELPDSAFAYVASGDDKDDRHLPYKDKDGKVDAAHVRNALARLDQTDIPAEAKEEARRKLEAAAKEVGIDVDGQTTNKAAGIIDAAKAAVADMAHCPECQKRVKLGEKVKEEDGQGGKHVTYKGECGHMVKKFEKDDKKDPETPDTSKGADTDPPSGQGEGAGDVKGNTTGDPPKDGSGEKQENDIIRRMQAVIDELEKNQAGSDNQQTENKALAQMKELVNAFVAHQQQEATMKGGDATKAAISEAVKAALAEAGILPDAVKAGRKIRKERLDRLKDTHAKLGDLIDELDDDPLENPEDASKAPSLDRASGGPTPVDKDKIYERIREGITEFDELARMLTSADNPLVHAGEGQAGNLGPDNKPVPPDSKPTGDTMDFTRGDGGGAPRAGGDTVKAVEIADAVKGALADVTKTFGEQLQGVLTPLQQRLATLEHSANNTTKAQLYVAENPGVFGQAAPTVQKAAIEDVRKKFSEMTPKEQEQFTTQLVASARRAQGAR
ncbi:hypothetical protein [Alicyclobacillus sp. ALC3]|uniref:hypothetical protein n=1 Tax=Alicyclobacillus sp. ALC3 TaxID=2796143 RepID=UPI0023783D54|nr:hypothetical protein [Alicyclobacillus sp. ALC3]WDL96939.1 hypothetical protein JC200_22115 [Alicyclobacillus sp. ALC3]